MAGVILFLSFVAETDKSFPSGHTFFAVTVFGMLAYLAVTHLRSRYLKALTLAMALILVLWVGAARIYLDAHWMSDVIGGYIIAALVLMGEIRLYQVLRLHLQTKEASR